MLCIIALGVSRQSGFKNRPGLIGLVLTLVGHALVVAALLLLDPLMTNSVVLSTGGGIPEGVIGPFAGLAIIIIIMDVGVIVITLLVRAVFRYVLRPTIFRTRTRTAISLAILIPMGAFAIYIYQDELVVVLSVLGSMLMLSLLGIIGLALMGAGSASGSTTSVQPGRYGASRETCAHGTPWSESCLFCEQDKQDDLKRDLNFPG